jgi:hypothetical protein
MRERPPDYRDNGRPVTVAVSHAIDALEQLANLGQWRIAREPGVAVLSAQSFTLFRPGLSNNRAASRLPRMLLTSTG